MQKTKNATNVAKANANAVNSKTAPKQSKEAVKKVEKLTASNAAKVMANASRNSQKIEIYLREGVTKGMLQNSLNAINKLHKADQGGYMYCLNRWLKFAKIEGVFETKFRNITAEEISEMRNLTEYMTEYQKAIYKKTQRYSVWVIGQCVKNYASKKG